MARKRDSGEEGGVNLDSLMDALTNVVAVLILVLLLVQADVTRKIEAFIEGLEPATEEQIQLTRIELEKLKALLATRNRQLEEDPPPPEEIEKEKLELARMEQELEENKDLLIELDKLKELERRLREERDKEKSETTAVQEEIARLEAQLDATPVLEAPPPEEVTIPNSRPIPANARIHHALVFGNRVHLIDHHTALENFAAEFAKHRRAFIIERVSQPGADIYIHDQRKIVDHFAKFDFRGPRGQKIEVLPNRYGARLPLRITPDVQTAGSGMDDLRKPGSEFERAVRALSPDRRAVVFFLVTPDSFNTYLLARKVVDDAGVPAGWEVNPAQFHQVPIPDLTVRPLEAPPPPPQKPVAPPPPGPPPLAPKLD